MNVKSQSRKNKYILYIDTSDPEAVIKIYRGLEMVAEKRWQAGRELSKTLSQKYSHILKNLRIDQKDIGGICVFVGPGSFTGLRIGISFVNGLAFGLGIPIYETKTCGKIDLTTPKQIAVPHYGTPPKITKPKENG